MRVLVVTAMYPTAENPAFGSFVRSQVEALQHEGIEIELLVLSGQSRKRIYPKGVLQVRQQLAGGNIDLIHAHYGYVGFVARMQRRVPVVVTYHGDDVMGRRTPAGTITAFTRLTSAACCRLAGHVDAAIVQTDAMAARITRGNLHVVPHEVDLELFQPLDRAESRQELGLSPDRRYLLFAANPDVAVKRFPLAKQVAERLAREDPSVELLVVYRESQERLARYMCAADLLIFPSFQEGSPNVVKQAMACNLPILSTDVGDVAALIGNTPGCYVLPPQVDAFAAAAREVLAKPERTRGREAVQHLAPGIVARQIIRIYRDVLRRGAMWRERQAA